MPPRDDDDAAAEAKRSETEEGEYMAASATAPEASSAVEAAERSSIGKG